MTRYIITKGEFVELETMEVVVLSTAHLSKDEAQRHQREWPLSVWENREYGFFVYVADAENAIFATMEKAEAEAKWPGLLSALRWAASHKIEWLRFDSDGDEIEAPGLLRFEW